MNNKIALLIITIVILFDSSAHSDPIFPIPFYPIVPLISTRTAYPQSYLAQPYSFEWEVKDAESSNDYSHSETSDGKVTSGSYRVLLPDGRTQIVNYKADINGYVADVKYDGEAKYPDYKPIAVSHSSSTRPFYKNVPPIAPAYYKAPVPVLFRSITPSAYRT